MTTATKRRANRRLHKRLAQREFSIRLSTAQETQTHNSSFLLGRKEDYERSAGGCSSSNPEESSASIVQRNRRTLNQINLTTVEQKRLKQLLEAMPMRDKKLLLGLVDPNKTKKQALLDAGYSKVTAMAPTSKVNGTIVRNQEAFDLLMQMAGISADAMAAKYAELFNCTTPFATNKKTGDFVMVPDNRNQLATLELIHKMRGELNQKHQIEVSGKVTYEHEHLIAERVREKLTRWDKDEQGEVIDVEAEVVL